MALDNVREQVHMLGNMVGELTGERRHGDALKTAKEIFVYVGDEIEVNITDDYPYHMMPLIPVAADGCTRLWIVSPSMRWAREGDSLPDILDFLRDELEGQVARQGYTITPDLKSKLFSLRDDIHFEIQRAWEFHEHHLGDHEYRVDCGIERGGESQVLVKRFYEGLAQSSQRGRASMRAYVRSLRDGDGGKRHEL